MPINILFELSIYYPVTLICRVYLAYSFFFHTFAPDKNKGSMFLLFRKSYLVKYLNGV